MLGTRYREKSRQIYLLKNWGSYQKTWQSQLPIGFCVQTGYSRDTPSPALKKAAIPNAILASPAVMHHRQAQLLNYMRTESLKRHSVFDPSLNKASRDDNTHPINLGSILELL